jgi:hypothetical protein
VILRDSGNDNPCTLACTPGDENPCEHITLTGRYRIVLPDPLRERAAYRPLKTPPPDPAPPDPVSRRSSLPTPAWPAGHDDCAGMSELERHVYETYSAEEQQGDAGRAGVGGLRAGAWQAVRRRRAQRPADEPLRVAAGGRSSGHG